MSVQQCDRNGCENVMCDRYSEDFGYICTDCFNELIEHVCDPKIFMNTKKLDDKYGKKLKKFHKKTMDEIFPIK